MKQRLLATLLSLCMLVGLMPTTAFAEEDPQEKTTVQSDTTSDSTPQSAPELLGENVTTAAMSGDCGATENDKVKWKLEQNNTDSSNPTYTLIISGSGAMADYSKDSPAPWASFKGIITYVNLPEGLTTVGSQAFSGTAITACRIPSTVQEIKSDAFSSTKLAHVEFASPCKLESIGSGAFWDTSELNVALVLPDSLKTIGNLAFQRSGITSVKFGENLETIGASAFCSCPNLTGEVYLPDSLENLGNYAFNVSPITSVRLGPNIKTWGGAVFNRSTTAPKKVSLTNGNGVLTISGGVNENTVVNSQFVGLEFQTVLVNAGDELTFKAYSMSSYGNSIYALVFLEETLPQIENNAFNNTSLTVIYGINDKITAWSATQDPCIAVTNGGTFAENTDFTSETLATPTRTGYTFRGWYTTEDFQNGTQVTDNTAEPRKTYYAKWEIETDTTWYDDGTAHTYQISNAAQLAGLAKLVNDGRNFDGKTVELSADINLNNMDWKAIGTLDKPFKGEFNGNGHRISNFVISDPAATYQGLFGYCESAKIYNFNMTGVDIVCDYRGGIVAGVAAGSTFENIKIFDSAIVGKGHIGGLIGRVQTMSAGDSTVTVTNCDMENVSVSAMSVADSWDDTVDNNANLVDSVTPFNTRCGGITSITVNTPLVISGCDLKNVTVKSWGYAGGLVGMAFGASTTVSIEQSSFSGTVDSKSGGATAGLATGTNDAKITVTDCRVEATLDGNNEVDAVKSYCEYPFISTGSVKNSTANVTFTRIATIFPSSDSSGVNSAEDCTVNAKFATDADIDQQYFLGYAVYTQSTTFKNCTVTVVLAESTTDVTLSAYRRENGDDTKAKNTTYLGCTLLISTDNAFSGVVKTGVGGTSPLYVDFDFPVTITPSKTSNVIDANTIAVLNGGTFAEDTKFTSSSLADPIKDDHIFDGWYTKDGTGDDRGTGATTIAPGQTYYAKWTKSAYSVSAKSVDFGTITYGSPVDAQTIAVSSNGGSGSITLTAVSSNESVFTAAASGSEVTVTPKANLDVGTYSEVVTITTPDNATFSVPVTITVTKAEPSLTITPSVSSLTGGGTVTLTVTETGLPDGATVSVTGNNGITVAENNGTYSANLPNTAATYTFTASYAGNDNYNSASDTCTVSVTQYTGGGSSGGSSSSNVSGSGDDVSISASGGTVTDAQMESAVKKADKGSTITIKATSSTTVTLPVGGMEDAADNDNDVLLDLRYGEVTLSARAIAGMTDGVSSNDKIKVSVANQTSSKDETISDLLDKGAAVFDVTVEVDGVEIHSFDGTLTITLTVSNLSKISDPHVLHILNNGTKEYYTPDRISGNTITVTGIRNLSTFAVIPGSEVPQTNPFTDVRTSDYYYDAVLWAADNGVTGGTSATTFSPNVTVTRAQMVTFLWRAHGSPKATGANPFTDVSTSDYYYDAVLWAVANGVTSGTSADTFGPDAAVTRAQAVTFQWRAAGSPVVSGSSFDDVAADAYYANAVAWAVANGITSGTGGSNFSPDVVVTRAQAVTFLWREQI